MFVCDSQSKVVKKLLFSSSVWPRSFPLHNLLCSWGFRCFLSHHYLLLMTPAITASASGWVPCVRLCRASLVRGFFWPSADMITRCNLGEYFPPLMVTKESEVTYQQFSQSTVDLPVNDKSASLMSTLKLYHNCGNMLINAVCLPVNDLLIWFKKRSQTCIILLIW